MKQGDKKFVFKYNFYKLWFVVLAGSSCYTDCE